MILDLDDLEPDEDELEAFDKRIYEREDGVITDAQGNPILRQY